jgi:hypothetical protein
MASCWWCQRRVCTARGRGHLWLDFKTLTFMRGPEWYCGHCLVVKLTGLFDWPMPPQLDDGDFACSAERVSRGLDVVARCTKRSG